jgi:hypothetical protein
MLLDGFVAESFGFFWPKQYYDYYGYWEGVNGSGVAARAVLSGVSLDWHCICVLHVYQRVY